MTFGPALLLGAVVAVGVLHTLVPDHWLPIAVAARRFNWTAARTAGAAAIAGLGHAVSTLAIGVVVWLGGVALAVRLGNVVSILAGFALVAFGLWIVIASLREMRAEPHAQSAAAGKTSTALLIILGSSPMVEGIPAFFAAARFGAGLLAAMAACFAISTITTYVVVCVSSRAALARLSLGPFERYGEVISGAVIAVVGVVFLVWSPE
ncbi:MAG TPA: hypothetical protein VMT95_00210 [Candidatus Binatia bacterium]|nr:hypothetical protein [Candidatus Binatia bacterium]